MKKIAITQRLIENSSYYEIRDTLDIRWTELFRKLDYLPILLPTNYDFETYFKEIKIDGIILSGGNDLEVWSKDKLSKKRDIFEKGLIKFAIYKNIPILGVCRGMQVIAKYFNGEFEKVNGHVGTKHKIMVYEESEFNINLRKLNYVNSYHNYAIKKIPDSFIVSAKSEDGVIEAIENKESHIFCQMWHSERQVPLNENELMIIKKIFN